MNRKQQKTFDAIFVTPTKANINFSDIEKLVIGLGGEIEEGSGSRVVFKLNGEKHLPTVRILKKKQRNSRLKRSENFWIWQVLKNE